MRSAKASAGRSCCAAGRGSGRRGCSSTRSRRAHVALSQASDADADADWRAWHRAAAATAPDEDLARELERAAERARARGGYAAGAALLRRAADLTPDDGRRAEREVALAEAELQGRNPDGARDLVDRALPRLTDDHARGLPGARVSRPPRRGARGRHRPDPRVDHTRSAR